MSNSLGLVSISIKVTLVNEIQSENKLDKSYTFFKDNPLIVVSDVHESNILAIVFISSLLKLDKSILRISLQFRNIFSAPEGSSSI